MTFVEIESLAAARRKMNASGAVKRHLECAFSRGMTWDNYGSAWEIDHILPCSAFDHTNDAQVRVCWNWRNLRPLWRTANRSKSARIVEPQQPLPIRLAA